MDRHNGLPHVHDCQACHLKFVSEERRDFHSSKVHDTEFSSELICKMCKKTFESEKTSKNNALVIRNFLIHLESPHEFNCDECEQTFTSKQFLKKHEEDEHAESLAKQQCSMCGIEIFKDEKENAKMKLKSHESLSHPHDCDECDFHFTTDLRLKHHENTKHDKDHKIELSCTLCGKDFEEMNQLFDHSETSHDYPCKFCDKEFTKKGLLTFHVNSNHKKDDEEEEIERPIRRRKRILSDDDEASEEQEEMQNGNDDCDENVLNVSSDRVGTPDDMEETEIEPPILKAKAKKKVEDLNEEFICDMCDLTIMGKKKFSLHEKKIHKFPRDC
jgi:hypothetical protein